MKKIITLIIFILIFYFPKTSLGIENIVMEVQKIENSLSIKLQIVPSVEFTEDFREGLSKNILISIELYRRWSIIPDEFISGFQIHKILISDPIKEEFIIKSIEGQKIIEKKFKNWQDALNYGLKVDLVKIEDINKLQKGKYYIKVSVESNIKKLPSVLEHLLFFIPKYEKKITKESERFMLP